MKPTLENGQETGPYRPVRDEADRAVTVDLVRSEGNATATSLAEPRVAVVEEAGPSLSSVTNRLRQGRLRAAALYLSLWWCVILFGIVASARPLWPLPAVVAVSLGIASALPSRRWPISSVGLRLAEFAIFGLVAAAFVVLQQHFMREGAVGEDPLLVQAAIKSGMINAITLLFAYTVLIPNSWRSAAWVVAVLAAYPLVTETVVFRMHPEVLRLASPEPVFTHISLNLTMLMVAAGLSLYGTHVTNTLRREAFEARRLNQYQLGACLGAGGMGVVHLAEHRLLKRPCAIKLIHPKAAGDPTSLKRFEREVRATARMSHPNIVEIYDYGYTEDRTFYYVMEYLRGLTFDDLVSRDGPLPAGRAIYLLDQACEGLAEAHSAGLIHRDLKPANLFAACLGRRHDVAKLLDFGLVKDAARGGEADREGTLSGTPLYMAPEQATGDPKLDHRCDLYALGAVAFFLLTGRPPFEAPGAVQVMKAHAREPVVPPSRYRPDLPADLERVVLRCLAKDPANRYPVVSRKNYTPPEFP